MAVNNMRNLQMYCVLMEPGHNLEAGLTKTYKIMKSYYKN